MMPRKILLASSRNPYAILRFSGFLAATAAEWQSESHSRLTNFDTRRFHSHTNTFAAA